MSELLEAFDGVLLSDGGVYTNDTYPFFSMALSGAEHVDWLLVVKSILLKLGMRVPDIVKYGIGHNDVIGYFDQH